MCRERVVRVVRNGRVVRVVRNGVACRGVSEVVANAAVRASTNELNTATVKKL